MEYRVGSSDSGEECGAADFNICQKQLVPLDQTRKQSTVICQGFSKGEQGGEA